MPSLWAHKRPKGDLGGGGGKGALWCSQEPHRILAQQRCSPTLSGLWAAEFSAAVLFSRLICSYVSNATFYPETAIFFGGGGGLGGGGSFTPTLSKKLLAPGRTHCAARCLHPIASPAVGSVWGWGLLLNPPPPPAPLFALLHPNVVVFTLPPCAAEALGWPWGAPLGQNLALGLQLPPPPSPPSPSTLLWGAVQCGALWVAACGAGTDGSQCVMGGKLRHGLTLGGWSCAPWGAHDAHGVWGDVGLTAGGAE